MEKIINKTRDTIIWMNNNANKFLIQALKNQTVEEIDNDNMAKGVISTKTFIMINLNE